MAQTLRSQVYNQMNQDIQNTIGYAASAMNSITQLKQTYDYSYQKQIEGEAKRADDERQYKIQMSNNPDDWAKADEEYFAHMADYMDQINAPQTVRNKWNNETVPLQQAQIRNQRATDEAKLYATESVTKWNSYYEMIGSRDDLDFEGKKGALLDYWNSAGLAYIPQSLVGHVTTVDEALESMRLATAQQAGMKAYAAQAQGEYVDYGPIVKAVTEAVPFNSDQEMQESITRIVSSVEQSETANKKIADSATSEMSRKYNSSIVNGDDSYTLDNMYEDLSNAGAFNPDGTINRYYEEFVMDYLDMVQLKQAQATTTDDITQARDAISQVTTEGTQTAAEAINASRTASGQAEISASSQPYVGSAMLADGELNFNNTVGSKTYKSGNESVTVEHGPVVDYLAKQKGITDPKALVELAKQVKYAEENTMAFVSPNKYQRYVLLSNAKTSVAYQDYSKYVWQAVRDGVFDAKELKDLGLWDSTYDKMWDDPAYKNWLKVEGTNDDVFTNRIKAKLFNVDANSNSYISTISQKEKTTDRHKLDMVTEMYDGIRSKMTLWLQNNPSATYAQFNAELDKAIEREMDNAVQKEAEKILTNKSRTYAIDTDSYTWNESIEGIPLLRVANKAVKTAENTVGNFISWVGDSNTEKPEGTSVRQNVGEWQMRSGWGEFNFPTLTKSNNLVVDNEDAQTFMMNLIQNGINQEYVIPAFVNAYYNGIPEVVDNKRSPEELYDQMLSVSKSGKTYSELGDTGTDGEIKTALAVSAVYGKYMYTMGNQCKEVFQLGNDYQTVVVDGMNIACIAKDGRCFMLDDDPSTSRSWIIGRVSDETVEAVFNSYGSESISVHDIQGAYSFKLNVEDRNDFHFALGQTPTKYNERNLAQIYAQLGYEVRTSTEQKLGEWTQSIMPKTKTQRNQEIEEAKKKWMESK